VAAFDAVVAPGGDASVGGVPRFASVTQAVAAAPANGVTPYRVFVTAGSYREKLVVDKPHVHLIGEGASRSLIWHDTAAGTLRADGQPWGTWGCASVLVTAPGFVARDLGISNTFDYIGDLRASKFPLIGANGPQAVALMLAGQSDDAVFERVTIISHQDTLFTDVGRSVFRDCRISGSVDFIFGGGLTLLRDCEIVSRFRPGKERQGFISAACTKRAQSHGLVFVDCSLVREPEVPDNSVALGRPWRPTRDFPDGRYGDPEAVAAVAFLRCWMDAHIATEGWNPMGYTSPAGQRVMLLPGDARFFEFDSRGPGAQVSAARPQFTRDEADAAERAADLGRRVRV
jgi:pectinesterase